ncbi:hypothetical protein BH10ACI3_BH10ACI3_17110 [soil metagenome]
MRSIFSLLVISLLAFAALGQKPDEVLATATGHVFHITDLSAQAQQAVTNIPATIAATRTAVLDQIVNQRLIDLEAKSLNLSSGKFLAGEKAKIANPTEAEIKTVYDANRQALGDLTLEQARKQIVAYLRGTPEQKMLGGLFARLKAKYKYTVGKDINAANLALTDVVATVNLQTITDKEFEEFAKVALFEQRASLSDLILDELDDSIYNTLLTDEAKSLGMNPGDLIAQEITNKMKDYSDEERFTLESALSKRLAIKYKVTVLYKPIAPVAQSISVDDDPATGPADGPVTIVMFSDFQCSACSATHPILKKAMAAYPGKIRFVVRDFPLESIHENGFNAALAAGAANLQGKFFDYTEVLYTHQNALDRASLTKYAADLGLNVKQFELDFNSEKVAAEVRKDMADGEAYLVNSTPTIFVNGVRVRNLSADGFKAAIDKALAK